MKIWYQSVTRNGRFPAYNDVLRRVIDRAKDPDTEVEIQGIERQGGTGDQYRYLAILQTVEVLEMCIAPSKRVLTHFSLAILATRAC